MAAEHPSPDEPEEPAESAPEGDGFLPVDPDEPFQATPMEANRKPKGRVLIEPKGYAVVSFLASLGIVIGVGMAWVGLWLAAAAIVLSVIESRELMRLNPWIVPREGRESPFSTKPVVRLMRLSFMVTALAAAAALWTVQLSGHWTAAVPPALLAAFVNLVLNYQLKQMLAREPD